jgi:hypothetical protein
VCGKGTCAEHRAACESCGRLLCTSDFEPAERGGQLRRCSTCAHLTTDREAADAVITAALAATGGARKGSPGFRIARDHRHWVVELDLGLGRRTVVALRHADLVAESVVKHSLLGSKRRV